MAAIDYSSFPDSVVRQLVIASYKATIKLFEDPAEEALYQEWLAKRSEADKNIERRGENE